MRGLEVLLAAAPVADAGDAAGGVDLRRRTKRLPPELSAGFHHAIGEAGAAQRRHGILALARRFEDVARRIDLALNVAGLSGHPDLMLHQIVEGLEIFVAERPVLQSRPRW